MASKNKYIVFAVIGIAAASGAAWWLQKPAQSVRSEAPADGRGSAAPAGAAAKGGGAGRPVAVEAVAVRQMALRDDAEAVGSLRSRQSVVLRPEVSGRITALNFRDGERVRRGQVLVQFDDQLPRAQVQQSQAELSIAQANHKRNQELVAQGFISQRSVDESAANLEVARAKLSLAQATASRLKIVAPFDGIAGIRGVNVGDYLKDGADIVNVEDLDVVYVDFRLPERLQSKVRTGQTAQVAFDALPGVRYSAVVQAINPQIDADGRSVVVRGCIDNRRLQLRPGMFARVTAVFSERSDARVIPEEAIVPDGSSPYVFKIVDGKEPGSRVARRTPVKLGARTPGFVEVVDGLAMGDVVVTAGQQRIQKDGTPVRVVELGKPGKQSNGGAPSPARAAASAGAAGADRAAGAAALAQPGIDRDHVAVAADRLGGTGLDAVRAPGLLRPAVRAQAGLEGHVARLLELADEFAQRLHRERLLEGVAPRRGVAVGQLDALEERLGGQVEHEVEALAACRVGTREVDRADLSTGSDAGAVAATGIHIDLQIPADRALGAGLHAGVAAHAQLEVDRVVLRPFEIEGAQVTRKRQRLARPHRIRIDRRQLHVRGARSDQHRRLEAAGQALRPAQRRARLTDDQEAASGRHLHRRHRLGVGQRGRGDDQCGELGACGCGFDRPAGVLAQIEEADALARALRLRQLAEERGFLRTGDMHLAAGGERRLERRQLGPAQGVVTRGRRQARGVEREAAVAVAKMNAGGINA